MLFPHKLSGHGGHVSIMMPLSRFPCSSTGHHRELHEADSDDGARPAGVQVAAAAAASF